MTLDTLICMLPFLDHFDQCDAGDSQMGLSHSRETQQLGWENVWGGGVVELNFLCLVLIIQGMLWIKSCLIVGLSQVCQKSFGISPYCNPIKILNLQPVI